MQIPFFLILKLMFKKLICGICVTSCTTCLVLGWYAVVENPKNGTVRLCTQYVPLFACVLVKIHVYAVLVFYVHLEIRKVLAKLSNNSQGIIEMGHLS